MKVVLCWQGLVGSVPFALLLQSWATCVLGWDTGASLLFGCLLTTPLMYLGRWAINAVNRAQQTIVQADRSAVR